MSNTRVELPRVHVAGLVRGLQAALAAHTTALTALN
jgi:hypothetical protein